MTLIRVVANVAPSELNGSINSTQTSVTLKTGDGANFGAAPFQVAIELEAMLCTSRTGDVLTVTRGYANTPNVAHGDTIEVVFAHTDLDFPFRRDDSTGDYNAIENVDMAGFVLLAPLDPTAGTHVGDRAYNDVRYSGASHTHAHSAITGVGVSDHHVKYTDGEVDTRIAAAILGDLSDVAITAIASGELLKWSGSAWINNTLAEAGVATSGHTHAHSAITGVGAADHHTKYTDTEADARIALADLSDLASQPHSALTGVTTSQHHVKYTDGEADARIAAANLVDLSDVIITAVAANEVIQRNGSSQWINRTLAEAGISGTSHGHTHVSLSGIGTSDHHTKYTDGEADARIALANLTDLVDVVVSGTPADNEVVAWNSGSSRFINQTAAEAGLAASGHTHAAIAHSALTGVTTSQHHVRYADSEADARIALADLADLATQPHSALSGVTASQHHTKYTDGEVDTRIGLANLSALADVTITAIASNEILRWSGSAWINRTLAEAGISPTSHSHAHSAITGVGVSDHHVKYTDGEADARIALADLSDLATKPHSALTGVGTSDHHVKYTDGEAAAKIAADDLYVKIAGDTMGGALNMGGNNLDNVARIESPSAAPIIIKILGNNFNLDILGDTDQSLFRFAEFGNTSYVDLTMGSFLDMAGNSLYGPLDPTLGTHVGDRDYNDARYMLTAAAPNAHTIASHSDTTGTGAELNTLTDGSNADSLHVHAGSSPALGDITDVTISAVATNEILQKSAGDWINRTLAEAGISATSHSHAHSAITGVGTSDHHVKYTSAEADARIALADLSDLATKPHSALTGVGTSDHHVKYTDGEAAAKIAADDLYVKIAGDVMGGSLTMGGNNLLAVGSVDLTGAGAWIGDSSAAHRLAFSVATGDITFYDSSNAKTLEFDDTDNRWEFSRSIDMLGNDILDVVEIHDGGGKRITFDEPSAGDFKIFKGNSTTYMMWYDDSLDKIWMATDIDFTSGNSFVADVFIAPTLVNSWVNHSATFNNAGYRLLPDGRVEIRGMIKSGTTTANTSVFNLPVGYRPAKQILQGIYGAAGAARVDIKTNGDLQTNTNWSATYMAIDMVFSLE